MTGKETARVAVRSDAEQEDVEAVVLVEQRLDTRLVLACALLHTARVRLDMVDVLVGYVEQRVEVAAHVAEMSAVRMVERHKSLVTC